MEYEVLISGIISILSAIISGYTCSALTKYRIEQLEKKVEKHNNIVEKTYCLEVKVQQIEDDLKELKHHDP